LNTAGVLSEDKTEVRVQSALKSSCSCPFYERHCERTAMRSGTAACTGHSPSQSGCTAQTPTAPGHSLVERLS